jgi:F-type H+-transporting ATPase subunit c
VIKLSKILVLGLMVALASASPAYAQDNAAGDAPAVRGGWGTTFSGAFGAGLTTLGAAYGIGKLAAAAVESQARQPEVAGTIQITMIIAAALIEGFTFFALVICNGQNPWAAVGG